MQRRSKLSSSLALAALMVCAGGIAPAPASRKQLTRAIDSRGLVHGFRQVTEADAERMAAAQAKRERKAKKRRATKEQ